MWTSAKLLGIGVLKHWLQLVSGALMALIALVSAIRNWAVPPWAWCAASAALVAWAFLKSFHDVRVSRDGAAEALRDKRDLETIVKMLLKEHHYGVHQLLHKDVDHPEWTRWVTNWTEGVVARMTESGCSPTEIEQVQTISIFDIESHARGPIAANSPLFWIHMHAVRCERVKAIAEAYEGLALQPVRG
jgi:hypothetical protein